MGILSCSVSNKENTLVLWLRGNNVVEKLGENVFLYDLSKIRGVSAILNRIPDNMSGVYAWYRNFNVDPAAYNNPEIFISIVLQELQKPHCVTRETRLPPSYKLTIKSDTERILSNKKQEALEYYAGDPQFRKQLINLLNNCLLFQQPLYIGKASNLRNRISNHLSVDSKLKRRLEDAEHNLEQCRLLILECSESIYGRTFNNVILKDKNESEFSQLEPEALIEDILSKLFLPSFSINYG